MKVNFLHIIYISAQLLFGQNLSDSYEVHTMDIQFYMPESNIVINEINYHPAEDFDSGDWVELYNSTSAAIDMSSWSLKDEDDEHVFILAENTFLGADQYIVLCRDIISFSALFPQVENVVGDFDFGLSGGGELIRLFDSNRSLIDTVHYDDDPPWPEEPDGNGPTLELINPSLDNALATNWVASEEHGTPGSVNTGFVSINDQSSLIPSELTLFQNYPNPFNATTTINFTIPSVETLHATSLLQIFDIIGRLVETLVSGELVAGKHSVVWDASNIASGVYFYSIQTENNVQTRKMILLK